MDEIELTEDFWDCECEHNYIHTKQNKTCNVCKAEKEEQPNSRINEVEEEQLCKK